MEELHNVLFAPVLVIHTKRAENPGQEDAFAGMG
jgi:hypothetical protein